MEFTNIRTKLLLNLIPSSSFYLFALYCITVCYISCQTDRINEVKFPHYLPNPTLTWKQRPSTYIWVSSMMLALISWRIHKFYKMLAVKNLFLSQSFTESSGCGKICTAWHTASCRHILMLSCTYRTRPSNKHVKISDQSSKVFWIFVH